MFDADFFDPAFFEVVASVPEPEPDPEEGPWISHGTVHLSRPPNH